MKAYINIIMILNVFHDFISLASKPIQYVMHDWTTGLAWIAECNQKLRDCFWQIQLV